MSQFIVKAVHKEDRGAYVALSKDNKLAGEMTYTRTSPNLIIIDHTETEDAFAGQGVGKLMVQAAIQEAREKGYKIMPLCPFAKGYFDKHPEEVKDIVI